MEIYFYISGAIMDFQKKMYRLKILNNLIIVCLMKHWSVNCYTTYSGPLLLATV